MSGSTTQASVLIVDDEIGPRESIRWVLEPRFRVTTAETGEQALDLLRHEQADVVTLDLVMPGIGGIETFNQIRELDSDVQIVIVSGGALEDLAHTLPHTASAWIPKPFDPATLVDAVARAAEETRCGRLRTAESRASAQPEAHPPAPETRDEWKYGVARMFSLDIKNRLTAILGYVRMLRAEQLDSGHTAQALDVIEGNAHEAVTLAVNFLHAEESNDGLLEFHKAPASLNQIVESVMEDEAPRARLGRIELRANLDSRVPSVSLDSAMMSRAVTNLLNNAIHRSPEGGVVRVETRRFADLVILRVRDDRLDVSGEGPELFGRYERGAKSASSSSMDLGLYLVRTIVEAHGGTVSVTLPADGGSAFVIVLPCHPHENA